MKICFASSALKGRKVTLAASQDDQSAGPVTVAAWGEAVEPAPVPDTAKVGITVTRSVLQVAPEGLTFEAVPAEFDNLRPADVEMFDPTRTEIVYRWRVEKLDGSGNPDPSYAPAYTAPENLIDEFRDATRLYGSFVAHTCTEPGAYRITVVAVEPTSGKSATASHEWTVADPETLFGGIRTLYVSAAGDFSTAPAHALKFDDIAKAIDYTIGKGMIPHRVMLRDDETYLANTIDIGRRNPSLRIVREGAGTHKPIIQWNVDGPPNRRAILNVLDHNEDRDADFSVIGVAFKGPWDAATETSQVAYDVDAFKMGPDTELSKYILLHDCEFDGFNIALTSRGTVIPDVTRVYSNLIVTNWGNFGLYGADNLDRAAFIGCRFAQKITALSGGGKTGPQTHNNHGPIRMEHNRLLCVDGCDFFSRNGWFRNSGYQTQQPCFRFNQNQVPGAVANFQRTSFEGGFNSLAITRVNFSMKLTPQNVLVDRCLFVGSYQTRGHVALGSSGFTMRNSMAIVPDAPVLNGDQHFQAFVETGDNNSAKGQPALDAPVRVHHNTLVYLRPEKSLPRTGDNIFGDNNVYKDQLTDIVVSDNLVHYPNTDPADTPYAPMTVGPVLWQAREIGYHEKGGQLLTAQATPPDTVRLYRPAAGSPALGASEDRADIVGDLFGELRPAYPSVGAFEAL